MPSYADQWNTFRAQLPPGIPDQAYDAAREHFFRQQVLPSAMREGWSEHGAREAFWKVSERPDRDTSAGLKHVGLSAVNAFTAPLRGLQGIPDDKSEIVRAQQAAAQEIQRQGTSPFAGEMVGQILGELPYLIPAVKGLSALSKVSKVAKVAGGAEQANRALQTVGGGVLQGTYEAAKHATDGHALSEGLKGAAIGTLAGGIFEYAGPMWRWLHESSEILTKTEAQAVEKLAKGLASPVEQSVAEQAIVKEPAVLGKVEEYVVKTKQKAKKDGVPETPPVVTPAEPEQVAAPKVTALPTQDELKSVATEQLMQLLREPELLAPEVRALMMRELKNRVLAEKTGAKVVATSEIPPQLTKPVEPAPAPKPVQPPVKKAQKLKVVMRSPQGQPVQLPEVDAAIAREVGQQLEPVLKNGSGIAAIEGPEEAIHQVYKGLDDAKTANGEFDIPVKLEPDPAPAPVEAPPAKARTQEVSPPAPPAEQPSPQVPPPAPPPVEAPAVISKGQHFKILGQIKKAEQELSLLKKRQEVSPSGETASQIAEMEGTIQQARSVLKGSPHWKKETPVATPEDQIESALAESLKGKAASAPAPKVPPKAAEMPKPNLAKIEEQLNTLKATVNDLEKAKRAAKTPGEKKKFQLQINEAKQWVAQGEAVLEKMKPSRLDEIISARNTLYHTTSSPEEILESGQLLPMSSLEQSPSHQAAGLRKNFLSLTRDTRWAVENRTGVTFELDPKYVKSPRPVDDIMLEDGEMYPGMKAEGRSEAELATEHPIPVKAIKRIIIRKDINSRTAAEALLGKPAAPPNPWTKVREWAAKHKVPVLELNEADLLTLRATRPVEPEVVLVPASAPITPKPKIPKQPKAGAGPVAAPKPAPTPAAPQLVGIPALLDKFLPKIKSWMEGGFEPEDLSLNVMRNITKQPVGTAQELLKLFREKVQAGEYGGMFSLLERGQPVRWDVPLAMQLRKEANGWSLMTDASRKVYSSPQEAAQAAGFEVLGEHPAYSTIFAEKSSIALGEAVPGPKPVVVYYGSPSRETRFHEQLHAVFNSTAGVRTLMEFFPDDKMLSKLMKALPELYSSFGRRIQVEETINHLFSAIRSDNLEKIGKFVAADDSLEQVMMWARKAADRIGEISSGANDSIATRILNNRLSYVKSKAGSILEIEAQLRNLDYEVFSSEGGYVLQGPRSSQTFKSFKEFADHLYHEFAEPITAPELVDLSSLPEVLLSAKETSRRWRKTHFSDGTPINLPEGGRIKPGTGLLGALFRPTNQWIESVARQSNWPELYQTYRRVVDSIPASDNTMRKWVDRFTDLMKDNLKDEEALRRVMEWRRSGKSEKVKKELFITPEELKISEQYDSFLRELSGEAGVNLLKYETDFLPRLRAQRYAVQSVKPDKTLTEAETEAFKALTKYLNPRDAQMHSVVGATIKWIGMKQGGMKTALDDLRALNNLRTDEKQWVTGHLRDPLQRFIEHMQGVPDHTYGQINSFIQNMYGAVRNGLSKVNKSLPDHLKMKELDDVNSRELLNKWMLLQYSASMGLRPMTWIRDFSQIFLTTLPILGPEYTFRGLSKALNSKGKIDEVWNIAKHYGAVYEHNPLADLYGGTFKQTAPSKVTGVAEWSLKPMQWANNMNRLASFWGHAEKAQEAFASLSKGGKLSKVVDDSGISWLPELQQKEYLARLQGANAEQLQDISYRLAKDLTDLTQWNYTRGGQAGLYRYSLGRLFGMYGTWPLNYIEYARMLLTRGSRDGKIQAGSLLFAMHYAVLAGGQSMGIDTGSWVFTQPGAVGPSPMAQAVLGLPTAAFDWETHRGEEARRQVASPIFPFSIPGGMTLRNVLKAINNDNEGELLNALFGFVPMKKGEEAKGIHQIVPNGEEGR